MYSLDLFIFYYYYFFLHLKRFTPHPQMIYFGVLPRVKLYFILCQRISYNFSFSSRIRKSCTWRSVLHFAHAPISTFRILVQ